MTKTNQLIIILLGLPILFVLYVIMGIVWVLDRLPTLSIKFTWR